MGCILLFIIGIIKPSIVIKWGNEEKRNRKKVCLVYGLGVIISFLLFGMSTDTAPTSAQVNNQQEKQTVNSKTEVKNADSQLWQIVLSIEKTNNKLIESLSSDDIYAVYREAESVKEYQNNFWSQTREIKCDGIDSYVEAVQLYAMACKDISTNLIKYMDKNEMKYLSKAQDGIEQLSTYVMQVAAARLEFLTNSGLSDDEVQKIMKGE